MECKAVLYNTSQAALESVCNSDCVQSLSQVTKAEAMKHSPAPVVTNGVQVVEGWVRG